MANPAALQSVPEKGLFCHEKRIGWNRAGK
jgi:hypothetical protein